MPVLSFCSTPFRHSVPRLTLRLGVETYMRAGVSLCVSLCVLSQFAACGDRADATVKTTADIRGSLRDDFGRQVDLSIRPTRVVSLNPTTTEIIYAIGAQSRLIGRSHWDNWPAAAKLKPELGDGIRPNVERLIAAAPDVVILYATEANRDAATRLAHAGIATISLRINTVQQFDRATRLLARVLGDSLAGAVVADSVEQSLARVRSATRDLPHPTVVWRLADRPAIVVGGGSFMNEMLQAAGATNLYAQIAEPSPVVSIEDIVTRNPDVVIVGGDIGTSVTSLGPWNAVPAVRRGKVISVSSDLVARPSVQMGAAAWALARALHPRLLLR